MRTCWRAFVLVPVWLITTVATPFFRPGHPWKGKRFTLMSWVRGATPISVVFGGGFWLMSAVGLLAFWCVDTHRTVYGVLLALFNTCFVVWFLNKTDVAP